MIVAMSGFAAILTATPSASSAAKSNRAADAGVWVSRPDGAVSCAPDSAQSLEKGADELTQSKIAVLESRKGSDQMLHAQMCGIPKGTSNAYRIPKSDLRKAIALGFKEAR